MAAPKIISAWAILIYVRTVDVQVNDNGIITWRRFSRYWPPFLSGQHRKGLVIFSMIREKVIDQTVELYMIWDTAKSMSRYLNGAWAGLR